MSGRSDGVAARLRKGFALRAVRWGLSPPGRPLEALAEHAGLRDTIRSERINVVVDVGANVGQFAAGLREIGFAGRILSFEPSRRDHAALMTRMACDRDWRGLQIALGDRAGTQAMNVVSDLTVMNSLLQPITASRPMEIETVEVARLDAVLPGLIADMPAPRILLKMDTQGFDLRCFAGAAGCLPRVRALFSELSVKPLYRDSPHYLESLATYEAAGFDLIDLTIVSRRGQSIQEMNCLMRRGEDG